MTLEELPENIRARELKNLYPSVYKEIERIINTTEFSDIKNVKSFLSIYLKTRHLSRKNICKICGEFYDPYKGRVDSCSRKCSTKMNWKKNGKKIKSSISASIYSRLEDDPNYFSNQSKKSFESRRKIYTEEELTNQYKTITEKRIAKQLKTKEERKMKFIRRLKCIKHIHLVIDRFVNIRHIRYDVYCKYINFLNEIGVDTTFEPTFIDFNIIKNNIEFCEQCGGLLVKLTSNSKFCSKTCSSKYNSNTEKAKTEFSVRSKRLWKDSEYRFKVLAGRDYADWSEKMLNTLGVEGRIARAEAANQTKLKRGIISAHTDDYKKYRSLVWEHTNKSILRNDPSINLKRSRHTHLDHIFPIHKGYVYGVPPDLIGDFRNLRLIKSVDNIRKGNKIILEEMNDFAEDLIAKYIERNV